MTEHITSATSVTKRPCGKVEKPVWYLDSSNLALLLEWMEQHGYSHRDQMYALRKPHKHHAEYMQACLEAGVSP